MDSLQHYFKQFILHCNHEKKLSLKTLTAYTCDVNQFIEFIDKFEKQNNTKIPVNKIIIRLYIEDLQKFEVKTIKRKIATLKAFFNFCEFEELIEQNPFRKMKIQIKEPKKIPEVLNQIDIEKLLVLAYRKKESFVKHKDELQYLIATRDALVIELLFATGARVSELSHIRISDIVFGRTSIKVIGKGNKERNIQIVCQNVIDLLREYIDLRMQHWGNNIPFLLINTKGNRLTDQSLRRIVKNFVSSFELQRKITPHTFRHTLATLLIEEGVDITYVQKLLGHSSITTTQIYTHASNEKQRQILESKHPRKSIFLNSISL